MMERSGRIDLSWEEKLRLANEIIEKKRAADRIKLESFHRTWFYKVMVPLRIILILYIFCVYFSPVIPVLDYKDHVVATGWYTHHFRRGGDYSERVITFEKTGKLGFRTGFDPDIVFSTGEEALIQRNVLLKPAKVYNLLTNKAYVPNRRMEMVFVFILTGFFLLVTFFYRDAASITFNKIVSITSLIVAMFYQIFA